jgi:NADPH:quinone reductase-like Zn-dependent oxidoreductase
MVGGDSDRAGPIGRLSRAMLLSPFVSQKLLTFVASTNAADLLVLKGLAETGQLRPVIDREYPFDEVSDAIRYLELGHVRGKVVLSLQH